MLNLDFHLQYLTLGEFLNFLGLNFVTGIGSFFLVGRVCGLNEIICMCRAVPGLQYVLHKHWLL